MEAVVQTDLGMRGLLFHLRCSLVPVGRLCHKSPHGLASRTLPDPLVAHCRRMTSRHPLLLDSSSPPLHLDRVIKTLVLQDSHSSRRAERFFIPACEHLPRETAVSTRHYASDARKKSSDTTIPEGRASLIASGPCEFRQVMFSADICAMRAGHVKVGQSSHNAKFN